MENKNAETQSRHEKKSVFTNPIVWILCFVVLAVVVFVIVKSCFVSVVNVSGSSMEPTIYGGESLVIDKRFGELNRLDIVTYYTDETESNARVSRIIAEAGDTVYIDFNTGDVYVNGEVIDEPYIKEPTKIGGTYITEKRENGEYGMSEPIVIDDGYIFVMGDNRNNSRDSREFGPIPVSAVFGVVKGKAD